MLSFTYPDHGPIPREAMRTGRGPPRESMQLQSSVPQESMTLKSRGGDHANAMTSTYIVDTNLLPTSLKQNDETMISYQHQCKWLRPGTPTLVCYEKKPLLGHVGNYAISTSPIVAMSMWNVLQHPNHLVTTGDAPYFTGFARQCTPGNVGSLRGQQLWTLSANTGGMVAAEVSDNVVRANPKLPIVAGDQLHLVRISCERYHEEKGKQVFYAIFCDNGCIEYDGNKLAEIEEFMENKTKQLGSLHAPIDNTGTTRSKFWHEFGNAFCTIVRELFRRETSPHPNDWDGANRQIDRAVLVGGTGVRRKPVEVEITPLGRVGRAPWITSERASDEVAVALAHFTDQCDTPGRLDVILCSS